MAKKNESKLVLGWVRGQGFPLEMRVAQAFAKSNYGISQGEYYADPDTGLLRELDVIARRVRGRSKSEVQLTFNFIVECKWTEHWPWVVFTSTKNRQSRLKLMQQAQSHWGKNLLSNLGEIRAAPESGLLKGLPITGYGVALAQFQKEAKGENGKADVPYKALSKVAVASSEVKFPSQGMLGVSHNAQFNIPIIVIQGSLYQARLSDSDEVTVEPINCARINWKATAAGEGVSVDVVTFPYLETYIKNVTKEQDAICDECVEKPELVTESSISMKNLFRPRAKK